MLDDVEISPFQKQLDRYYGTISPMEKTRSAVALAQIFYNDKLETNTKAKEPQDKIKSFVSKVTLPRLSYIYLRDQDKGLGTRISNTKFNALDIAKDLINQRKQGNKKKTTKKKMTDKIIKNALNQSLAEIVYPIEKYLDELDVIVTNMMTEYVYKPDFGMQLTPRT